MQSSSCKSIRRGPSGVPGKWRMGASSLEMRKHDETWQLWAGRPKMNFGQCRCCCFVYVFNPHPWSIVVLQGFSSLMQERWAVLRFWARGSVAGTACTGWSFKWFEDIAALVNRAVACCLVEISSSGSIQASEDPLEANDRVLIESVRSQTSTYLLVDLFKGSYAKSPLLENPRISSTNFLQSPFSTSSK